MSFYRNRQTAVFTKRTLAKAVVPILAATALGGVSAASAHASDPGGGGSCESIDVSGYPGIETFTLHVDWNGCGYPVKAWAVCFSEWIPPYGWHATGDITYSSGGTSEADCSPGEVAAYWGYWIFSGGTWHQYDMEHGTWDS
ncbi:hypothetical protein OG455_01815 [Kitasatospora sp. NBC_01287]|uniref:hypothetical protein n=1 Tax=Kitasatospora sp. NBC_01287 TaxID=2903573 RepID=UPI00224E9988|nr:hypothetical protein [Kitasatospora sp. NBC_01287]MCX4744261.1 hypothetical protein [Kitasatospora sp. NBC_01287]